MSFLDEVRSARLGKLQEEEKRQESEIANLADKVADLIKRRIIMQAQRRPTINPTSFEILLRCNIEGGIWGNVKQISEKKHSFREFIETEHEYTLSEKAIQFQSLLCQLLAKDHISVSNWMFLEWKGAPANYGGTDVYDEYTLFSYDTHDINKYFRDLRFIDFRACRTSKITPLKPYYKNKQGSLRGGMGSWSKEYYIQDGIIVHGYDSRVYVKPEYTSDVGYRASLKIRFSE